MDKADDTATDYDKSDIVTQFRRAAEKFPDNIAVVYGETNSIIPQCSRYRLGRCRISIDSSLWIHCACLAGSAEGLC